jgi:hypothetical protein
MSLRLKAKRQNIKQQKQTNATVTMTNSVTVAGMEQIDSMRQIICLKDESCSFACANNGSVIRFGRVAGNKNCIELSIQLMLAHRTAYMSRKLLIISISCVVNTKM